jgi:hypothetical protein
MGADPQSSGLAPRPSLATVAHAQFRRIRVAGAQPMRDVRTAGARWPTGGREGCRQHEEPGPTARFLLMTGSVSGSTMTTSRLGSLGVAPACLMALLTFFGACSREEEAPIRCETTDDCPMGSVCKSLDLTVDPHVGTCAPGCRDDSECESGFVCSSSGFGGVVQCVPGCRDDSECEDGFVCWKPSLFDDPRCMSGCRRDADCEAGQACVLPGGSPGTCQELRTVPCGDQSCDPVVVSIRSGEVTCPEGEAGARCRELFWFQLLVEACCPASSEPVCGLEVAPVVPDLHGGESCQAIDQPGTPSASCPDMLVNERGDALDGCLRSDGTCGFSSDSLSAAGIECVDSSYVQCAPGERCDPDCEARCEGICRVRYVFPPAPAGAVPCDEAPEELGDCPDGGWVHCTGGDIPTCSTPIPEATFICEAVP